MGPLHLASSVHVPVENFVDQPSHLWITGQVSIAHPQHRSPLRPSFNSVVPQHCKFSRLNKLQFFVSFEFFLFLVVVVESVVVGPEVLELIVGGSSEVVEDLLMGRFAFFAFGRVKLISEVVELFSNVLVDGVPDVGI